MSVFKLDVLTPNYSAVVAFWLMQWEKTSNERGWKQERRMIIRHLLPILLSENWCTILLLLNLLFFLPGLWTSHGCHYTEIIQQPGKWIQPDFFFFFCSRDLCASPRGPEAFQNSPQSKPGLWKLDLSQVSAEPTDVSGTLGTGRPDRCQQCELSLGLKEHERGIFLRFTLDLSAEGYQRAKTTFRENSSAFFVPFRILTPIQHPDLRPFQWGTQYSPLKCSFLFSYYKICMVAWNMLP